jgi:hypothetical protein
VIAIDDRLAVVALQQVAVAFHDVAVCIRLVALRSGRGTAIGAMGKAAIRHCVSRLRIHPSGSRPASRAFSIA